MKLIPMPQKIEESSEKISYRSLNLASCIEDSRVLNAIKKLPLSENGAKLEIVIGKSEGEGYTLSLDKEKVYINAEGVRGAFYAVQTLRQIFENDDICTLTIEDKPDFEYRGFYHDITRGKVPTMETLKDLVDKMAYYKLNSLQLYIEHTFEFKEFADSIERTGYMSAEEMKELDKYCIENFIELIPSLSTFGHLYELLQKDRYKHLQAAENFKEDKVFWYNRMWHHTIDPTQEESFELIKSLIDQYIVCFTSDKFNICCDETFDLTTGKHRDKNTGELYVAFVKKIADYVKSKGKTVMMWADILLQHPEVIDQLPEDMEFLNWEYDPAVKEDKVKALAAFKNKQIVCPGTSSWNRFCEVYQMGIPNITRMAEYGYKYGASGVLNTNWGDWGNLCSLDLAMAGFMVGAEKSWNVKTAIDEEFESRADMLMYKKDGAMKYIKDISVLHQPILLTMLARSYSNCIYDNKFTDEEIKIPTADELEKIRDSALSIYEKLSSEKWENDNFRIEMMLATEGIAVVTEYFARVKGGDIGRKTNQKEWFEKYRTVWMQKNKKSEIDEVEKMFNCMEKVYFG